MEVKDILEVLENNNFPNSKQVELLQILNYALFVKNYPQDICGRLEKKIQIIQQPTATPENANTDVASIKVRSVVILELLKKMQLGTAQNDLSKICKLIAFLTGNSYNSIYNELQKGVFFSKFHGKQIDEANKLLAELNASIFVQVRAMPNLFEHCRA